MKEWKKEKKELFITLLMTMVLNSVLITSYGNGYLQSSLGTIHDPAMILFFNNKYDFSFSSPSPSIIIIIKLIKLITTIIVI